MTKNKVDVSQVSLLLLLVITGGKFLSLPSVLAKDVGHDSWLVLCVAFLWDAICLCFVLRAVKLNKHRLSIDEILDKTVTKAGSTAILVVFFVIFMCRIVLLLEGCYNAFAVTFDVNTNWVLFMLPIVAVSAFAISRGFNSVARVGQVLFALVLLSLVALLVNPTTQTEFSALLPVCEAGFGNVVKTSFVRSFWFSDYIFIYFVFEEIKPKKHLYAPVFVCFAVGVVLTVLLNAVFVALYGELAQYNNLAMSKIGLFSVAQSTDGRWDWITLTVWLTSVILKIVTFVFCAYKCVEKIFRQKFVKINWIVIGVIAIVLLLPMFLPVETLAEKFIYRCVWLFAIVQYLLPMFLPLLCKVANGKQELLQQMPQGECKNQFGEKQNERT